MTITISIKTDVLGNECVFVKTGTKSNHLNDGVLDEMCYDAKLIERGYDEPTRQLPDNYYKITIFDKDNNTIIQCIKSVMLNYGYKIKFIIR